MHIDTHVSQISDGYIFIKNGKKLDIFTKQIQNDLPVHPFSHYRKYRFNFLLQIVFTFI